MEGVNEPPELRGIIPRAFAQVTLTLALALARTLARTLTLART